MLQEKRIALTALVLIFLFFLGFSLVINLPVIHNNFLFADQAVYYSMAQSIAFDGDLEFTKKDLIRYYHDFSAGPNGIFLKKGTDGRIFYAKSFAHSLFAAPFVRIFSYNGIFVFHSLLLLLLLLMGFSYFSLSNKPILSLIFILSFLFASVAGVYFVWISPDFFNLFLVFSVLFLWLYKVKYKEMAAASAPAEEKPSKFQLFLRSDKTDYLASFLAGIATFSKPHNVILMGPLVLWAFVQKKFLKALLIIFFFILSAGALFGINYLITSDWNFMGGERKTFYFNFPFEKEGVTFDSASGWPMTSEGYFERFLLPFKFIFYNIFYYFFGRFTGIVWYFFPALLLLVLFILGKRPRFYQWLTLGALAAGILIYVILMPTNYGGGGGSLANRYFLNIYPLFLFLPSLKIKHKHLVLIWVVAALFISQILIDPFTSSSNPAAHAKRFPFKLLPVEMTLINEFPTNTNPAAFRVPFGTPPNEGYVYFLNDNFNKKQEGEPGVWTWGPHEAEMILKTPFPAKKIIVHLLNNPRHENEIKIKVEGKVQKIVLGPRQKGTLEFDVGNGFQMEPAHLYRMKIKASKGSTPYFENESSKERRYLGVFFELEIVPRI